MKTFYQHLLIAAVVLLGINSVAAQPKITLNHLGVPSFYTDLSIALTAAQNGDTLYLPGGIIQPQSDITINKSVHIIGAGHYPDSTAAIDRTKLVNINYLTGSGGGSIEGCVIINLRIGYATAQNITGLSIKRCTIASFMLGSDNTSTIQNISLTDNVITNGLDIKEWYSTNIMISRNIINSVNASFHGHGLFINNNIIYCFYSIALSELSGCVLENNIIIGIVNNNPQSMYIASNYCQYQNNLFIPTVLAWSTNSQLNSLLEQTTTATFINANTYNFDYSNNYHLLPTSPGKNYGTDGTDVGLYGTPFPYKDGAVPSNPHIFSKSISGYTTPSGMLHVNISVSAQQY